MSTPVERLATLETRVSGLLSALQDAKDDHEALQKRVDGMERLQQWLTGAGAVIGFIFGLFSGEIKKHLGLP